MNTMTDSKKRGDMVTTPAGAVGRYIGTTSRGLIWTAWPGDDFARMCAAFDATN